jgi:hypothetical protein
MLITRTSPLTGNSHSIELDITEEQIAMYNNGALLQDAFPNLNSEEREFFKSGITPIEWKMMMTIMEDDDEEIDFFDDEYDDATDDE